MVSVSKLATLAKQMSSLDVLLTQSIDTFGGVDQHDHGLARGIVCKAT